MAESEKNKGKKMVLEALDWSDFGAESKFLTHRKEDFLK